MSVRMRQYVERQIAQLVVRDALRAKYVLAVELDGELQHKPTTKLDKVMKHLFVGDDARLLVGQWNKRQFTTIGWVYFVYGNDGPDVINDYTSNLAMVMVNAEAMADYWDEDGEWRECPVFA